MNNIIYFEIGIWASCEDYPDAEPFRSWIGDGIDSVFSDDAFVHENNLCVVASVIDQTVNFCITATRDWVEKNCPELLAKYTKFLRWPDKDGIVYGRFGDKFLEYNTPNIGITYV